MPTRVLFFAFLAASAIAPPAIGQVVFYAAPGSAGAGTCDAPFGTVREALAAASLEGTPTEVRLAEGTFVEAGLTIAFSNVQLKGGYDPMLMTAGCADGELEDARTLNPLVTVIDGDRQDRILDVVPDLSAGFSPNDDVVIDRITFENGLPMRATPQGIGGSGGAISVLNCTGVAISNSVFRNNQTNNHFTEGGAIYLSGYPTPGPTDYRAASLVLTDNTFEDNSTGDGDPGTSGFGGALAARDSNQMANGAGTVVDAMRLTTLEVTGTTFRRNVATAASQLDVATFCPDGANQNCDGVGIPETCNSRAFGGALSLVNVAATMRENVFEENRVVNDTGTAQFDVGGGAVFSFVNTPLDAFGALVSFVDNIFRNNVAMGTGNPVTCNISPSSAMGGAVQLLNFVDGTFRGNVLEGNRAHCEGPGCRFSSYGGAAWIAVFPAASAGGSGPIIEGNTFSGNSAYSRDSLPAGVGGAVYLQNGADVDFIVRGNVFESNSVEHEGATGNTNALGGALAFSGVASPVIAGNVFRGNSATAAACGDTGFPFSLLETCALGGAAMLILESEDAVFADNVVIGNTASASVHPLQLAFSGVFLRNDTPLGRPATRPLVQGNLFVENAGVGLALDASWFEDTDGDTVPDDNEITPSGALVRHNTFANNDGPGLATNMADDLDLAGNILHGNDVAAMGTGNWLDDYRRFSGPLRATRRAVVQHNLLEDSPAVVAAEVGDPANGNLVGMDPRWTMGPGVSDVAGEYFRAPATGGLARDYYLAPATSPCVDHRPDMSNTVTFRTLGNAAGHDFDQDGAEDHLQRRTTDPALLPDDGRVDLGYHYPLAGEDCGNSQDDDFDGDTDCDDADCIDVPPCADEDCFNGIDDDGDGDVDCDDSDCDAEPACGGCTDPPSAGPGNTLRFEMGAFMWATSADADTYPVHRGTIPGAGTLASRLQPYDHDGGCLVSVATPSFDDGDAPEPDSVGYYYLIGAANACGQTDVGVSSLGDPRPFGPCP